MQLCGVPGRVISSAVTRSIASIAARGRLLAQRAPGRLSRPASTRCWIWAGQRPVKGSLENGWPAHIQQRVLAGWNAYGFPV
jgi:hypothetical protein